MPQMTLYNFLNSKVSSSKKSLRVTNIKQTRLLGIFRVQFSRFAHYWFVISQISCPQISGSGSPNVYPKKDISPNVVSQMSIPKCRIPKCCTAADNAISKLLNNGQNRFIFKDNNKRTTIRIFIFW